MGVLMKLVLFGLILLLNSCTYGVYEFEQFEYEDPDASLSKDAELDMCYRLPKVQGLEIYRVKQDGVEDLIYEKKQFSRWEKGCRFLLRTGRYRIWYQVLIGSHKGGQTNFADATIELRSGHRYVLKARWGWSGYKTDLGHTVSWIEDQATGDVILKGSRHYTFPATTNP